MRGVTRLLPQLEELRITVLEITDIQLSIGPALQALISPTITTFDIDFDTDSSDDLQAFHHFIAFDSILGLLDQLKLQTLRISCSDIFLRRSVDISKRIGTAISKQTALTSIVIRNFLSSDPTPLMEASLLPHLERVYFTFPKAINLSVLTQTPNPFGLPRHSSSSTPHEHLSFPSVRYLTAEVSTEGAELLLPSVTSASVDILALTLEPSQQGATLGTILETAGRFTKLRRIFIMFPNTQGTWPELRPLLSCHCVETVSLRGDYLAAAVGDDELHSLAAAWPFLKSLTIVDHLLATTRFVPGAQEATTLLHAPYPPAATLMGLSTFAMYCPHLTSIKISIDARGTPLNVSFEAIGASVVHINFPYSLADEAEQEVAHFIRLMWPNHKPPWPDAEGPGTSWHRIWELAKAQAVLTPVEGVESQDEAGLLVLRAGGHPDSGGNRGAELFCSLLAFISHWFLFFTSIILHI